MKKVIIISTILFLSNSIVFSQNPVDLLPEENEIPGWVFDTDSLCKEGLANDSQSLYDVIDGGAEVYVDRGFVNGAYEGYTDGSDIICLEIFNQGSAANAYQVYHYFDITIVGYYNVPDLGDSAHIDTNYLSDTYLELIKNNYFIRLVCPKDAQYIQTAITMAQRVVEKSVPIIYNPENSKINDNVWVNIYIYPSNGNFLFKISLKSLYLEKSEIPELLIYNLRGLLIQNLEMHAFGPKNYLALWDRKNSNGSVVANGVYSLIFRKDNLTYSKKIIVQ